MAIFNAKTDEEFFDWADINPSGFILIYDEAAQGKSPS